MQWRCRAALATSLQRMLEEHTYFAVIYMLWQRDDVWSEYGPHVFEDVPFLMRGAVSSMVRSGIVRDLHGQVHPSDTCSHSVRPHRHWSTHSTGRTDLICFASTWSCTSVIFP